MTAFRPKPRWLYSCLPMALVAAFLATPPVVAGLGTRSDAYIQPNGGDFAYLAKPGHFDWVSFGISGTASDFQWHRWGRRSSVGFGKTRFCITMGGGCHQLKRIKAIARQLRGGFTGPEGGRVYIYCELKLIGRFDPSRPTARISLPLPRPHAVPCRPDARPASRARQGGDRPRFFRRVDGSAGIDAQASRYRRNAISFHGIGGVRWGAKLPRVEDVLGISFDCSEGLVPSKCLCPPSEPDLSIGFVFDLQVPQFARLQAVYAYSGSAHTRTGISIGSSKRAVERAYPGARYEVNAPLNSGISTFLLARRNGHALVFSLDRGRVRGIGAYARGGSRNIEAEQCA
jgi:hypothetical protein